MVAGLVTNAGLLAAHLALSWEAKASSTHKLGATLVAAEGLVDAGVPLTETSQARPCHLLRYGSDTCAACAADRAIYLRLAEALSRRGCDVVSLAPGPRFFDAMNPFPKLAFPTARFAETVDLQFTPTTIVADRGWSVVWSKIGALDKTDVAAASRAAR
jgi:hypothetical protein